MKKYFNIFAQSFFAYFKFNHYAIFPLWLKILLLILFIPFHFLFLFASLIFIIMYTFITMIRVPAEFIKHTIDENNEKHPATQVVVYLVAYPSKFFFDFTTATVLVFVAWVFLFSQVIGYVGSLGNFYFQPFLMQATTEVAKPKPTFKMTKKQEIICLIGIGTIFAVIGISALISNIVKNNRIYDEAVEAISTTVISENMQNGYIISGVFYEEATEQYVFHIRFSGNDIYFSYIYGGASTISKTSYDATANDGDQLNVKRISRRLDDIIG